jgi:AraC-like DNA-binding protein
MPEKVKFWREPRFCNLELLRARYITHSFCRHTHDTFAIGVIQHGAEEFSYRGATHVAPAGSIAVINPGEVHTGHAANEKGWAYRMLYPDVQLLQQAASEISQQPQTIPYFPVPVVHDPPLAQLILNLHIALEESTSQLEQDSRLLWTMAQMIARHADLRTHAYRVGHESEPIRRVREYLDTHYADNISLDELGAIANLSSFYLLRTFRKQVGLPPHEYLNQVRLAHAKQQLAQGYPIAEVAIAAGFSDQSHLTRQFKRIWGVTPGHYQQKGNFIQDPSVSTSVR